MKFSIRLKQLVDGLPGHERGPIMRICEATGLERHAVSALYHNRVRYVSMNTLGTICDYLVEYAGVPRSEVLPRLFGLEVGDFWGMLVRPQHLRICAGLRNMKAPLARRWIMASDALLQGKLLHKISQSALHETPRVEDLIAGAAKRAGAGDGEAKNGESDKQPRSKGALRRAMSGNGSIRGQILEQQLVEPPPERGRSDKAIKHAEKVYHWVDADSDGEQALVCLGSPKSNPVAELVYANAFGLAPFHSPDVDAEKGAQRCPIFYLYREEGPQPESCCGGTRLPGTPPDEPRPQPGIYFETVKGKWEHCACDDKRHMCAVVFYVYRRDWGRVEAVIGGFSSQSTEQLALVLPTLDPEKLMPCYESRSLRIGAAVLEFDFKNATPTEDGQPLRPSIKPHVIEGEVMKRRVVE